MARVLVVDDNDDVRLLMNELLTFGGHDVIEMPGGAEALRFLSSPEARDLDLVVLDVQMPNVDGWEVLQAIRAERSDLRIVMCTVKGRPADRLRGWKAGCDGFLIKPFDIITFRAEVDAVLSRDEADRSEARRIGVELAVEMDPSPG